MTGPDPDSTVTRTDQLSELTEGRTVAVIGVYRPTPVDMRPPGEAPRTACVFLIGGGRVLIGAYGTAESLRGEDELARLAEQRVRVVGTFRRTTPYPHAGPPPAMWVGGGPQVAGVTSLDRA